MIQTSIKNSILDGTEANIAQSFKQLRNETDFCDVTQMFEGIIDRRIGILLCFGRERNIFINLSLLFRI